MRSNRATTIWGCAVTVVLSLSMEPAQASSPLDDNDIKLSGCLVRGEDGGYLLTNVPGEPVWQRADEGTVIPDAVGTSGTVATVFYWLDDDDDLKSHVGHLVEVEGDIKGKIEDGDIKVERKDNWTEIRLRADDRELKARIPRMSIVSGADRDDRKLTVLVRQVDVEHVRMLDANCQR
jgi:hypothetical protein